MALYSLLLPCHRVADDLRHRTNRKRCMVSTLMSLVVLMVQFEAVSCQGAGDLYCGRDNCYHLMDLERGADPAEIKKAYRKLALKWHPDKNRGRKDAEEKFKKIARAYEVLSEEKLRNAYHHYLDNPDARIANYYRYYHAVYTPQTPLWIVITGTLTFFSILQYLNQKWRYSQMMRAVTYQQNFKRRVNQVYEEKLSTLKGKISKAEREVLRDQVEKDILEKEVRVSGDAFTKPSLRGLILVRTAVLPYTIGCGLYSFFLWHWRFSIKGEDYGEKEHIYLTCRALGIRVDHWDHMPEEQRDTLIAQQLWIRENLEAYIGKMREEQMEKRSQSGAYRRYKRHMARQS